jgi:hypothetical protein
MNGSGGRPSSCVMDRQQNELFKDAETARTSDLVIAPFDKQVDQFWGGNYPEV